MTLVLIGTRSSVTSAPSLSSTNTCITEEITVLAGGWTELATSVATKFLGCKGESLISFRVERLGTWCTWSAKSLGKDKEPCGWTFGFGRTASDPSSPSWTISSLWLWCGLVDRPVLGDSLRLLNEWSIEFLSLRMSRRDPTEGSRIAEWPGLIYV